MFFEDCSWQWEVDNQEVTHKVLLEGFIREHSHSQLGVQGGGMQDNLVM